MPVDRRPPATSITDRAATYLATQTDGGRKLRALIVELHGRRFPLHWSNMFAVVSLACVAILFVSGIILMFYYSPSSEPVTYHGTYLPLDGATVSKAFRSTVALSFEVRGGLMLRQIHHWSALLLPASIMLQMLVTFFTGGFRRPRRLAWVLLFLILIVAMIGGWSGYALPDDMLSGTGLRIVEGIVLGIPVIGSWLSALLFGGQFPGAIIEHLYPIHVAIVPVLLLALIALRVRAAYRSGPAQFPGPGRTEHNVIGVPLLPSAAARGAGLFMVVSAVLVLISATVTISPVWLYGPSSPADASAGSQPDWYTGFLDGALRLVPPGWGFVWLGHTWSLSILVPLVVVGAYMVTVLLYPLIEDWISGDTLDHNILDRPRNVPLRTGIGAAGITFYATLWAAASADVVATQLGLSLESVLVSCQCLLVVGPILAFSVARRVCVALVKKDLEILAHGYETGRIVRMPSGEYIEIHGQLSMNEKARLATPHTHVRVLPLPDKDGRVGFASRARAALADLYFANNEVTSTSEQQPEDYSALRHESERQDLPRAS